MTSIVTQQSIESLVDKWLKDEENGIEFPVDFDIAWQLAGYSRKDVAKRKLLESGYFDETQFHISAEMVNRSQGGGRKVEIIKLTCDAFKEFCMLSKSETGKITRKYFIECEKKWKLTQEHFPQVAQTIEDIRLDKILEIERVRLQNKQLDDSMLKLHGKETVLLLRGYEDNVVTVEKTVTEIVNPATNTTTRILTADQLKSAVKNKVNQKLPSQKWFIDKLRENGRDDLIVPVTRSVTGEYVIPEKIDEAIKIVYGSSRQCLLGE